MTRVCRACLQIITDAECYSLNQPYPNSECSLLRDRCKACVPEMDLDLTTDAVLCGSCYSTFTLFYHLRLKCLETEKKLRNELRERSYISLAAFAEQNQLNVTPYLLNENRADKPNENVSCLLTGPGNLVIKQECEGADVNDSTNIPGSIDDLESIFEQVTEPVQSSEDGDNLPDVQDDLQNGKQQADDTINNRFEVNTKVNGSVHSASSADFMESKYSRCRSKKAFKCLDCDYSTSHRINLQNHIKSHFGNKPYKCNLCGYKALQKCFLKSHMTMHSGTKPFKCNQCDYRTAYRGNLRTHLRKHTGEKPYKCDLCNNSYTQSNSLNRHIKTHANAKPLKCCLCDYRTMYKNHLRNHMMLHTGEKCYICDVCNQKFSHKLELACHMKEHSILNL